MGYGRDMNKNETRDDNHHENNEKKKKRRRRSCQQHVKTNIEKGMRIPMRMTMRMSIMRMETDRISKQTITDHDRMILATATTTIIGMITRM